MIDFKKAAFFGATVGLLTVAPPAMSQDAAAYYSMAKDIMKELNRYLLARDDATILGWVATNGKCGYSQADRDYRARILIRTFNDYMNAINAQDINKINYYSNYFPSVVNRSTMYQSCWNTIKRVYGFAGSISADFRLFGEQAQTAAISSTSTSPGESGFSVQVVNATAENLTVYVRFM